MASCAAPRVYARRRPETTDLYRAVAENLDLFYDTYDDRFLTQHGLLTRAARRSLDAFLSCGCFRLTPRNWGGSLRSCIRRINAYLKGWFGFFGICTVKIMYFLWGTDAHIRCRLRAIQLAHWKCKRTRARKLTALGVRRKTAWRHVYEGRKSLWALSHSSVAHRGLHNAYFAERGLVFLVDLLRGKLSDTDAPAQLELKWG